MVFTKLLQRNKVIITKKLLQRKKVQCTIIHIDELKNFLILIVSELDRSTFLMSMF